MQQGINLKNKRLFAAMESWGVGRDSNLHNNNNFEAVVLRFRNFERCTEYLEFWIPMFMVSIWFGGGDLAQLVRAWALALGWRPTCGQFASEPCH